MVYYNGISDWILSTPGPERTVRDEEANESMKAVKDRISKSMTEYLP